jgi:sporulation protein YlmC with PRC-barrel domain
MSSSAEVRTSTARCNHQPYVRKVTHHTRRADGNIFARFTRMTLRPLSSIDSTTIGRSLDLRGWRVISRDGTRLGTVSELIIDLEAGSPVYINIVPDLPGAHSSETEECWIRVPFVHTSLDDDGRRVVLSDVATLGLGTATAGLVFSRGQR